MTQNRKLTGEMLDIVEELLENKDITVPSDDRQGYGNEARLFGMEYALLLDEFENLLNLYYPEGAAAENKSETDAEDKVFVLNYSSSDDGDWTLKTNVYDSFELARKEMMMDIESSKKNNFWYDHKSGKLNEGYVTETGDDYFKVYELENYNYNHERWYIEVHHLNTELFSDTASEQAEESDMEM